MRRSKRRAVLLQTTPLEMEVRVGATASAPVGDNSPAIEGEGDTACPRRPSLFASITALERRGSMAAEQPVLRDALIYVLFADEGVELFGGIERGDVLRHLLDHNGGPLRVVLHRTPSVLALAGITAARRSLYVTLRIEHSAASL